MNALRTSFALRVATITVTFFAWVVLSNHCALAEMLAVKTAPAPTEEQGCCKHQPAPAGKGKPCPSMPQSCCKSLTVVVPHGAKLPVAALLEVVPLSAGWLVVFPAALPEETCAAPAAGPPPDVPGFVELVLHRSLRSHAPPLLA